MWDSEMVLFFFCSSRRRHTRCYRDWSSDVCSSDLDLVHQDPALGGIVEPGYEVADGDRKSTRLNSSHGSISYAVFCLNKKNTTSRSGAALMPDPATTSDHAAQLH